ncbi:MAG: ribosomal protein L13e [Nitrososphaerota archaeon]|nr:ribosomal protein L13e [Nitrososphaerales archaeon]MDW8044942.1 ribosomal protein L13e [Nitrososphaerota archaeon]
MSEDVERVEESVESVSVSSTDEKKVPKKVKSTNEPPVAKVICRDSHGIKFRVGRGFSLLELKEAGLSIEDARRMNLRIDLRRKTMHKENIDLIKDWLHSQSKLKEKDS